MIATRTSTSTRKSLLQRAPLLVIVLVISLLSYGYPRTASADSIIVVPPPLPPPAPLLNTSQLASTQSPYSATTAQQQSLQNLEQAAVSATVKDHGLPSSDASAVQTWGRDDAEAALWALLVQAIKTPACTTGQTPGIGTPPCRTTDQQNAVDWMAAMVKNQAVLAADNAGKEYVKWAGLDQTQYQSLVSNNAGESSLQSFLSGRVVNYNNSNTNLATGGYCVYRSPAPYDTEYTGFTDQTCVTSCTNILFGCAPPTPTYDQFVKWGEADVNNKFFNSTDFAAVGRSIAIGAGFGGAVVGAGVTGAALSSGLASVMAGTTFQTVVFPFASRGLATGATLASTEGAATGEEAAALGGEVAASGVAFIVAIVILAVVSAVLEGIQVFSALAIPGQLATLIAGAPTTTPDLGAMLGDADQTKGLFSLFVGATLPSALLKTCDNSQLPLVIGNEVPNTPCLNAPAMPGPAQSDPEFAIQAQGSTTKTDASSLTWKDAETQLTTIARISGNWFVDQMTASDGSSLTAQTLRIRYTDWNGNEQTAWLLGNDTDGYRFVGFEDLSQTGTPLDPSTCLTNKTCSSSSTINYVGSDGKNYSASVIKAVLPTVQASVTTANPVEGSPVQFSATGSSPNGLPLTFQWQFGQLAQTGGLGPITICSAFPCGDTDSGTSVSRTWQTSGSVDVQVRAVDSAGKTSAIEEFTVNVGNVPPTLALSPTSAQFPTCQLVAPPCEPHSVQLSHTTQLSGTITHAGSLDSETVAINWGDFTSTDYASTAYGSAYNLAISGTSSTVLTFSGSHQYTGPGHYNATVTVTDQASAQDSITTTETVWTTTTLTWNTPAPITYGTPLSATQLDATVSADGSSAGVPGTFTYTDVFSPVTSGEVLSAKQRDVIASFTPDDPTVFTPPTPVGVLLTVNQAPLTITAGDKTMTYGGSLPALDATYSGFVNGENVAALTTPATCTTTATNGSPAGSYPITCSGAVDRNYAITYKASTLTVTGAPLKVAADNKSMLLHGTVPSLTYGYSGFVNGDTAGSLTNLPICTTKATSSSPTGSYPITCSGAVDPNYTISYVPGTLSLLYRWSGFSQPINDPTAGSTSMSIFKAGSTVTVKFQLKDANGTVVQAGSLPTFSVTPLQSCAAGSVDEATSTATGDTASTYRWDSTNQQYIYNYKPPSSASGMCQNIQATLDDGTTKNVYVGYK